MNISCKIDQIYAGESILVRRKAKTLFWVNFVLAAGFAFLGLVRGIEGQYAIAAGEIILAVLLFAMNYQICNGRFILANIVTMCMFLLAAVALYFLRVNDGNALSLFVLGSYLLTAYIAIPMLVVSRWQIIVSITYGFIIMLATLFLRVLPTTDPALHPGILFDSTVLIVLMLLAGFFMYQMFMNQLQSFAESDQRRRESEQQFARSNELLQSISSGANIGDRLMDSAGKGLSAVKEMHSEIERVNQELESLQVSLSQVESIEVQVHESGNSVDKSVKDQQAGTADMTEGIREIASRSEEIETASTEQQSYLQTLISQAGEGKRQLEATASRITNMAHGSKEILSIIRLIEDIADRTNLLAMNAAIEAAHAGESGRGFAVVAQEIRKLSLETNENSKKIQQSLQKTSTQISETEKDTDSLNLLFAAIIERINHASGAFGTVLERIRGMNNHAAMISGRAADVHSLGLEVQAAVKEMLQSLQDNRTALGEASENMQHLHQSFEKLSDYAGAMFNQSGEIELIGRENLEKIQGLMNDLSAGEHAG
ncbi:methyl-accepting chemotaxis protein [Spirochaeta dissipatitropha]